MSAPTLETIVTDFFVWAAEKSGYFFVPSHMSTFHTSGQSFSYADMHSNVTFPVPTHLPHWLADLDPPPLAQRGPPVSWVPAGVPVLSSS